MCIRDRFNTDIPKEVNAFILKGHQVYDYIKGDLNGDGREDAILILEYKTVNESVNPFLIPVSYTHLDVYKRQEWIYPPSPLGEGRGEAEGRRETSTMPGYAGSSWYFLRYMDPNNDKEFVSKQASDYWNSVCLLYTSRCV